MTPEIVDRCERCRTPWSVNAFAEQFAIAALRDPGPRARPAEDPDRAGETLGRSRRARLRADPGLGELPLRQKPRARGHLATPARPATASGCATAPRSTCPIRSGSPSGRAMRTAACSRGSRHAWPDPGGRARERGSAGREAARALGRPADARAGRGRARRGRARGGDRRPHPCTPFTQNWCRAHDLLCVCTEGAGYIDDIAEAAALLDLDGPVLCVSADLPCLTGEIVGEVVAAYGAQALPACSTWVPVDAEEARGTRPLLDDVDGHDPSPPGSTSWTAR